MSKRKFPDERVVLHDEDEKRITIGEKMSLEESKKLLNANENNYTDEQVLIIRDFFYQIETIEYLWFTEEILPKKRAEGRKSLSFANRQTNKSINEDCRTVYQVGELAKVSRLFRILNVICNPLPFPTIFLTRKSWQSHYPQLRTLILLSTT